MRFFSILALVIFLLKILLKSASKSFFFALASRSGFGATISDAVARSSNVQNTSASDHFWQLRCGKRARRCGAKHMSKSKCTKHLSVGPLLAVEMWKKCTPLWREAHFQVKMYKALGDVASLHYTTLHYTPLHYRTLHYTTLQYTTLHYTTLQYTPLH